MSCTFCSHSSIFSLLFFVEQLILKVGILNSIWYLAAAAAAKLLQSCPTLCDPIDSSPPGPAIPGILQARTLEWVAISPPMHESEK